MEPKDRAVEAGIPQGPPVPPILVAVCISGVFEEVERKAGAEGLSFVDDVVRVATGKDAEEVTAKLKSRRRMGTSQCGQLRRRQNGGGPLSEGPEGDSS